MVARTLEDELPRWSSADKQVILEQPSLAAAERCSIILSMKDKAVMIPIFLGILCICPWFEMMVLKKNLIN